MRVWALRQRTAAFASGLVFMVALAGCGSRSSDARAGSGTASTGLGAPTSLTTLPGASSPTSSSLTSASVTPTTTPCPTPTATGNVATVVSGEGMRAVVPVGWDAKFEERVPLANGGTTSPTLHAGNFGLHKVGVGSFGEGEWPCMNSGNVLVSLIDDGAAAAGSPRYTGSLSARIEPDSFSTNLGNALPRGGAAMQRLFTAQGRGFDLFVVIGSYENRQALAPLADQFLAGITILPVS